jgi:hypothetical protein
MATWKKVVVSGSDISQLNNDSNYLIQGQASAILSGSFSGSFQGDGSNLTGVVATAGFNLTDGNGLNDFTYNGSSAVSISVQASGSSLNVDANGVGIAAGGVLTSHIADNAVTADKLDDVFSDTPGSFGSSTAVPVITIDGQGRILSASTATISTTIAISGSTAGSDTVSLIDDALTFAGAGGITATVTDNTVTFGTAGSGFISASAEGDAQGQIKLNGVNVNINALGTDDSPSFTNLTVTGDLTVSGTTTSLQVTNLNVEDTFILLNSGSAAADAGLVVNGAGSALGWDQSEGRWALDYTGATWDQTSITSDAFVASVITGDDSNYDKVGNIKVASGEIYIYV